MLFPSISNLFFLNIGNAIVFYKTQNFFHFYTFSFTKQNISVLLRNHYTINLFCVQLSFFINSKTVIFYLVYYFISDENYIPAELYILIAAAYILSQMKIIFLLRQICLHTHHVLKAGVLSDKIKSTLFRRTKHLFYVRKREHLKLFSTIQIYYSVFVCKTFMYYHMFLS